MSWQPTMSSVRITIYQRIPPDGIFLASIVFVYTQRQILGIDPNPNKKGGAYAQEKQTNYDLADRGRIRRTEGTRCQDTSIHVGILTGRDPKHSAQRTHPI